MGIGCAMTIAKPLIRKAVFLDRDGVINRAVVRDGKPYPPDSLDTLVLLPSVHEAMTLLKQAGFLLIVVTNQPDVARGTTPVVVVEAIHADLMRCLPIDDIRCCLHSDEDHCDCRKPKPGALLAAARDHRIGLPMSFMVGDRWRDIDAGHAAGVRTILLDYAYCEQAPSRLPDYVCHSLLDAARWILSQKIMEQDIS